MNPARWERVQGLYWKALDLPEAEREAFLDRECGTDRELRTLVTSMLQGGDEAAQASDAFLHPPAPPAPAPPPPLGSPQSLGPYQIQEELGRGAMGVVYRAQDPRLQREVAVKVMGVGLTTTEREIDRFRREARSAAKLNHPGIVPVLDVGEDGEHHYFAMELCLHGDLHGELDRQRAKDGLPPEFPGPDQPGHVAKVATSMAEVAEALHYAHGQGVVHRDVKPQNLLLDPAGKLRVVDFGLAKDESQGSASLSGEIAGTPYYMSPEQAAARRSQIDHRTDVYSLGVVMYEMLTLERPFRGKTTLEILSQISNREPRALRSLNKRIPRDLDLICRKAMAKEQSERYASAGALGEDLRRFLNFEAIEASPASLRRRLGAFFRRHRAASLLLSAALVALVCGWFLAGSVARNRKIAAWGDALGKALEQLPWDGESPGLALAQRSLSTIRSDGAVPRELRPLVERTEAEVADEAQRRTEEIRRMLQEGKGGYLDSDRFRNWAAPASLRDMFQALSYAGVQAGRFPDRPELQQLARIEAAFPRLNVELAPIPQVPPDVASRTRAIAIPLDPVNGSFGAAVPLGPLPVQDAPLAPGPWRIVVLAEDYGFAELDRVMELDHRPTSVVAFLHPKAEVQQGMTTIIAAGGFMQLDEERPVHCCLVTDEVPLAPFLVDTAEVSNGEYLRYLQDTGAEPPIYWTGLGFDGDWRKLPVEGLEDEWANRPMAGLSCIEARSFAEYHGKRLPSHYELEFAHRGPDRLRFPWGTGAPPPDLALNIYGVAQPTTADSRSNYRSYLERTVDVRSPGAAHPPFGLFHACGNVEEWTWGDVVLEQGGRLMHYAQLRIYMGGSWSFLEEQTDLRRHSTTGTNRKNVSTRVGFRCARSLTPPAGGTH